MRQRKLDFLNQKTDRGIYNPHGIQDPVSPYEVLAGSIIAGSLLTGINSDLPGEVSAVYPTFAPPGRWLIERLKLCANKLAAQAWMIRAAASRNQGERMPRRRRRGVGRVRRLSRS